MNPAATETHDPVPNILVVDDTPANLQLLAMMLKERGYRVRPVPGGRLALQAVRRETPDLILLDINMPEMNGYEVCEQLKADDALKDIPVLFISALDETTDKIKAFAAGGVDYVTKPFQFEEVEARVQTHLRLRRLQIEQKDRNRQLQDQYDRLQKLEQLRDNLTHMIVHDMRSPLMGIFGNLEYAMQQCALLPEDCQASLSDAMASSRKLVDMVSSLLDVSRLEAGQMPVRYTPYDLRTGVRDAVAMLGGTLLHHPVSIQETPADVGAMCDTALIQRVLANLLGNAAKFSPPGSPILIEFEDPPDLLRVSVRDRGPGIPPESHARIFEKFVQVDSGDPDPRHSTGLGLTFCKLAVEAHGGQIGVESAPGQGSRFWFTLPRHAAA